MNKCWCLILFFNVAGFLGIGGYFIPTDAVTASVVVYILCQAFMIGNFYLVIAYTPDLFSTDTRNFAFAFLDAVSKVVTAPKQILIIRSEENTAENWTSFKQ